MYFKFEYIGGTKSLRGFQKEPPLLLKLLGDQMFINYYTHCSAFVICTLVSFSLTVEQVQHYWVSVEFGQYLRLVVVEFLVRFDLQSRTVAQCIEA